MSKRTFTYWLRREAASARCALLALFEQRDRLQYIEGPRLEKEYMDQVGSFETTVIREEIECELLRKKQQMIQTAINRREPVDEAAIDAELENCRRQMLQEAEGPSAPQEYAELSAQQSEELQNLYHDILQNFHPQTHPDLTKVHRELFRNAQEAYRRRDVEALRLIHEMLCATQKDGQVLEIMFELLAGGGAEGGAEQAQAGGGADTTDFSLAADIYAGFKPTEEEAVMQETCARDRQAADRVLKEMEQMQLQFPYTAAGMLSDPEKIQAYKQELTYRLHNAAAERERRSGRIREMMESVAAHG